MHGARNKFLMEMSGEQQHLEQQSASKAIFVVHPRALSQPLAKLVCV
jgi:hypothetical protein